MSKSDSTKVICIKKGITRRRIPAWVQFCSLAATGFCLAAVFWLANSSPVVGAESKILLEVFVRQGCPHCAAAKAYLPEFSEMHPEVQIQFRSIDKEDNARDALQRYCREAGIWPPGVPAFYSQGQLLVGFASPQTTGPKLHALVGDSTVQTAAVDGGVLGTLSVERLGLPLFTLALGLLDGFNPCAMWVLLFLLSLLVHIKSRTRMALIAGTFVLVSGFVYYLFMAAWLNIFLAIGLSSTVIVSVALLALIVACINLKDFFWPHQGISLSIPDAAKPGLYARMRQVIRAESLLLALLAAALLAIVVNFIELLCTAGLPAMYTAILTQQSLSPLGHYAYLGLYILGYMADDTLIVATSVIALSSRKLTEKTGQWLKLLSGVVMLFLGGAMLLKPEWLF